MTVSNVAVWYRAYHLMWIGNRVVRATSIVIGVATLGV